jgi:hypothetical protein
MSGLRDAGAASGLKMNIGGYGFPRGARIAPGGCKSGLRTKAEKVTLAEINRRMARAPALKGDDRC